MFFFLSYSDVLFKIKDEVFVVTRIVGVREGGVFVSYLVLGMLFLFVRGLVGIYYCDFRVLVGRLRFREGRNLF